MRLVITLALSLAIAGYTTAQTTTDSTYLVKKKYEQTKKNCIYLDTVTTNAKQVQATQKDIISKLRAIREKQMASTKPE